MNPIPLRRFASLLFFFLIFQETGIAQGWEHSFPVPVNTFYTNDPSGQNRPLSDGSALVFNFFDQNVANLIKINPQGEIVALDDSIVAQYATARQKLYDLGGGEALLAGGWQDGSIFLIRLDTAMQFGWLGTYKTPLGNWKNKFDFERTADGGWFASVFADDSLKMLRLSPGMDTLWYKKVHTPLPPGNYIDPVSTTSVVPLNNGGFLVYGNRQAYQWPNFIQLGSVLVWVDSLGNIVSEKTSSESVSTILPNGDGFLHVREGIVEKWSSSGDLIETVGIGSLAAGLGAGYSLTGFTPLSDGNWAVCGHTLASLYQFKDVILAKITPSGALLWVKKYGSYFWPEKGGRVVEMPDHGFLLQARRGPNKVYLIRTDSLGVSLTNQIDGQVFLDDNNNCAPDSGEVGLPGHKIRLTNDIDYYEVSDSSGRFFFNLGNGAHPLRISAPVPYWKFCADSLTVALAGSQTDSIYFALQKVVDCPLLRVDMAGGGLRRCFSNNLSVSYCNEGTAAADSVTLRIALDSFLIFENATLPLIGQQGNVYEFAAGALEPGACGSMQFQCTVSCDAPLGYVHCATVRISPDTLCLPDSLFHFGDDAPAEERLCLPNQGAFDPNDKSAWPEGTGNQHLVQRDSTLKYLIRFQNTGTDTAFNVVILDALSPGLDPLTLRPGASSHLYTWEIGGEGILKFTFANILLPDSNINEPASHGFVRFSIKPKASTPVWSEIPNLADIYFDFNDPVRTNTVSRTIDRIWKTRIVEKAICAGKSYAGVLLTTDTILVDTLIQSDAYLVQTTVIQVLDSVRIELDTVVTPGTFVYGYPIYADKTVTKKFLLPNGCDSTLIIHCFVVVHTGEADSEAPSIQIFPNPANDFLLVQINAAATAGFNLRLFDGAGRVMRSEKNLRGSAQGQAQRVNLTGLSPGIYWIEISSASGVAVRKFLKN